MVSAESLNFDVLQIIFAHLSVPDLASVSQVNRSFLEGALPSLYRSLGFYLNQAKGYPRIVTPFAVVSARPDLAAHVQSIDIRVIPNVRVKQRTFPDPRFFRDCISALEVSDSLTSFTCTVGSTLPRLLPFIQSKPRLRTLRIEAGLTREQSEHLCQIRGLHSLALENASSAVMDALPKWAGSLKFTMEHLTIHMSPYLNGTVLQSTVQHLPRLRSFYVVGCLGTTHIDTLAVIEHTPFLESLALTVWGTVSDCFTQDAGRSVFMDLGIPDSYLTRKELVLPVSLFSFLQSLTRSTRLASLALRLSEQQQFPTSFVNKIMEMHGPHLRAVRFMGFMVSLRGLESLMGCDRLEKLAISIPTDDIVSLPSFYSFASVLAASTSLHTLIDVVNHGTYGKRTPLTTDRVKLLLEEVHSLTRVVSENRLWSVRAGCWLIILLYWPLTFEFLGFQFL
ncbi:hypothetical protein EDB92DRAFT_1792057 [Lactarius akahatsu]|uniref:F-box domain-containing protein n=1 Tax=Lactarius akahatsu TaxID=416441 RepID=A0AAD4QBA1_9AGAM|nr:hypothetical protein EDB92DRAFT_1792057 [Lactarius akahatsu]